MNRAPRVSLFAVVGGLSASFAYVLAYYGSQGFLRHSPVAPWFALLLLLSTVPLGWVGRRALGPRAPIAAALGVAMLAPMIVLGALNELGEPLVHAHPPICGTPRVMLEMSVPPAMLVTGCVSAGVAALLVAAGAAKAGDPPGPPSFDRRLHTIALASAAIAAVLVLASLVRAARRPVTDGYVDSLPHVATFQTKAGPTTTVTRNIGQRRVWQDGGEKDVERPVDAYDDEVDGVLLRRTCAAGWCYVSLVPLGTPPAEVTRRMGEVTDDTEIEIRRDSAHGLRLVHASGWRAYRGPQLQRVDVGVPDVAGSLSPPPGWILGAASGLALAGAALALRRRAARHRAALAAGREGTLEPSGLLRPRDDDAPLRVAPDQALALGPVVVLPGPVAPGGVYRGDALLTGARVACGARDELLAAADAAIARLDGVAFAAVALAAAPLVASALVGIVF